MEVCSALNGLLDSGLITSGAEKLCGDFKYVK